MKRTYAWLPIVFAAVLLGGCAAEGSADSAGLSANSSGGGGGGGNPAPGGDFGSAADAGSAAADAGLPPEQEEEAFDLRPPRASRTFVFIANTTLNTVVRVDSITLAVTPIEVCLEPTVVQTLPELDRAVALCRGDSQLAVVDAEGGDDDVRFTWLAEHSNRVVLSPTGQYALAWYDDSAAEIIDNPGNPHDLTLVDLGERGDEPQSYLLSVGFGIRSIQFDGDGTTAFVTTEDGLNIVRLAEIDRDQFIPLQTLGDDPLARAADREVLVTEDGHLAFVRTSTYSGLRVLDIDNEVLRDIPLPAVPTDLDLFADGRQGVAVLRDIGAVALLPLPEAVDDPDSIELIDVEGELVGLGQLHEASSELLLYSTVTQSDRLTILNLETSGYETFALRKPIQGVRIAPSGSRAIIFHDEAPGVPVPGEPINDFVAKSAGYTLFDLSSGAFRLVQSETTPDDVVFTAAGDQAYVMLEDSAADVRAVQRVQFGSFRADTIELARPPEAIGVVPATQRIFVSQLADTGRITFIDTETGRQQHVTAYQLNRRIE